MSDINDFYIKSKAIRQQLGFPIGATALTEYEYNGKLSDNPDIKQKFIDCLTAPGKRTLICAPTGSGKTYTVADCFSTISTDIKANKYPNLPLSRTVLVLVTPNRIQNLQNGECYDLNPIIGTVTEGYTIRHHKAIDQYNLNEDFSFSIVLDKLPDVIIKLPSDTIPILCIDEAHLMIDSRNYRKEAIKQMQAVIDVALKRGGSVVYMTATPDPLMICDFNEIICCNDTSYTAPAEKIQISLLPSISAGKIRKDLSTQLTKAIKSGYRPFVRLNSKDACELIANQLSRIGYPTMTVNAEDKGYITAETTSEDGTIIRKPEYKNRIFGNVIENSLLPDTDDKGKRICAWLTTSLLEVGTNIVGVGDDRGHAVQDASVLPVYVCQDTNNASANSIIQFFARVRYKVRDYAVYMPDTTDADDKKVHKFKDILQINRREYENVTCSQKDFKSKLQQNVKSHLSPEEIKAEFDKDFASKILNSGEDNNLGCISLNDSDTENPQIEIDWYDYWLQTTKIYSKQYFYHPETLAATLAKELSIHADIAKIEEEPENAKLSSVPPDDVIKAFDYISDDDEAAQQVADSINLNNRIDDPVIRDVEDKAAYKLMVSLAYTGEIVSVDDIRQAILLVSSGDKKKIKKEQNKIVKEICGKILKSEKENNELRDRMLKHSGDLDFSSEETKVHYTRLSESDYYPHIVRGLKLGWLLSTALNKLIAAPTVSAYKAAVGEEQCRIYNSYYVTDKGSKMAGNAGREQKALLDAICKYNFRNPKIKKWSLFNDSGNLVQIAVTKAFLDYLAGEINKLEHKRKSYTTADVKKLLNGCFMMRKKSGHGKNALPEKILSFKL